MKFFKYSLLILTLITFNLFPQKSTNHKYIASNSILNKVVTLNLKGSLSYILNQLSNQYNLNFVYSDNLINGQNISINAENKILYSILDEVLNDRGLDYYEFSKNKFVITRIKKTKDVFGNISGIVKNEHGEPLIEANIVIKELHIGTTSDTKGYYILKNIKPGEYDIEISYLGYETHSQKINIQKETTTEYDALLKIISFQIGGIEVIGCNQLLPTDINTKTIITSGEIEHYQASSIKDVLDLVPGISKTENPGLGKTTQVSLRGNVSGEEKDRLSSLGTLVIVDGTPISNNANLQFERLSGSKFGVSTLGSGIDLRMIPADNVEQIEIISGLPSVKYGDLTSGLINVQTKLGPAPHRFKFKNNPDTREGNLGGGIAIGEYGLNYNFNAAQSERDVRKKGDEYLRVTGQSIFSGNFFDNTLNLNSKINFQTIFDEEEPKGDQQIVKNYNRGFIIGLSSWGKFKPSEGVSTLEYNSFVTMFRENSMRSRLVQSDNRILPNGDTISSYMGKIETKGIEWTIGGRIEWSRIFYTGEFIHKFSVGTDPLYNVNTGQGILFDTLFSYYGTESGKRPYSFDKYPGQFLADIYAEDKITGHFIFDFNLLAGFRYDMYSPYSINLKGLIGEGDFINSHQGTFFNPRLSLLIYLSENNQLRISLGTTSKSPSMNLLYPAEEVTRWRNPIDSSVKYFRNDYSNSNLKGFKEIQYEAAFDQKIGDLIGSSLSFYYKKRSNEPLTQYIPLFISNYDQNNNPYIYYITNFKNLVNRGVTESKGIEFAFKTKKIKPLNLELQLAGSYNFIKEIYNVDKYELNPNTEHGLYSNYKVPNSVIDTLIGMFYPANEKWNDRLQLNYYLRYTLQPLGLWVTIRMEQVLFERNRDYDFMPEDLNLLTESEKINYLFYREIRLKPNKLLFNLNISKSLFAGSEVSFYVNNFLDEPAIYRSEGPAPGQFIDEVRNPGLTYGLEFSMALDNIFQRE
ncbi:MAG TPA: TonB-dependent receptor [Ignavibacteriaceae bacterium]|nr:TonB-dependent receptor [Ignavibacteriaceae bacterium]